MRIQIDLKSFNLGLEDGKTRSQYRKSTGIVDDLSYWSGYIEGSSVVKNEKNTNAGLEIRREVL